MDLDIVYNVNIIEDCFNNSTLNFNIWRNKLAELQGYDFLKHKYISVPDIDWENINRDNVIGKWDYEPNNPLDIIYCHSVDTGCIYKKNINSILNILYDMHTDIDKYLNKLTNAEKVLFTYDKTIFNNFMKILGTVIDLLKVAHGNNLNIRF